MSTDASAVIQAFFVGGLATMFMAWGALVGRETAINGRPRADVQFAVLGAAFLAIAGLIWLAFHLTWTP